MFAPFQFCQHSEKKVSLTTGYTPMEPLETNFGDLKVKIDVLSMLTIKHMNNDE